VITKSLEITGERSEVEATANQELLQANCISKGSAFARAGDVSQAQAIFKAFKRGNQKSVQTGTQKEASSLMFNN
jgi:hypothetical protein